MTVYSGSVDPLSNFKMFTREGNVTLCLKTARNLKIVLLGIKQFFAEFSARLLLAVGVWIKWFSVYLQNLHISSESFKQLQRWFSNILFDFSFTLVFMSIIDVLLFNLMTGSCNKTIISFILQRIQGPFIFFSNYFTLTSSQKIIFLLACW